MKKLKTLKECVNYTLRNKHAWIHGEVGKRQQQNLAHVYDCIGTTFPVSKLDRPILEKIVTYLDKDTELQNGTINMAIGAIRTVLNYCDRCGVIDIRIPSFRELSLPVGETQVIVYTAEQVHILANSALNDFNNQNLADAILTYAWTGMRVTELLKLKVKDIDLHNHNLRIGGRKDWQNKNKRAITVPIIDNSPVKKILMKRSLNKPNDAYLFADDWGSYYMLTRAFSKVAAYALPDFNYPLKYLRHTFCTTLIEQNVPLEVVRDICNHSDIKVTQRYARATNKAKRDALQALAKAHQAAENAVNSWVQTTNAQLQPV
tara:strand:- start:12550 stop:13503 length:954 start_codon:yes stop_codon:yes gene_type:complete